MTFGFWKNLKKPFFALAPMADVSDLPFRTVVREIGRPDVFFTEFVSADGLDSKGREKLLPYLAFEDVERPIVAQFFTANPEKMRKAAETARELGFDGIDINMGCPVDKVVKHGAGIALCKTPDLAKEIIMAAKEGAGDVPVSVKTRLGYNEITLEWIQMILNCDISALTVHLRTMKEMSVAPAHWEVMAEVVKMAHEKGTLIMGNGDIKTMEEGRKKCAETGADGIMIGRGIFENPLLFAEREAGEVGKEERLTTLMRHTKLFVDFWGKKRNFDVMKRFFKIYASNWDGAKELRIKLMEAKNFEEVQEIIDKARVV